MTVYLDYELKERIGVQLSIMNGEIRRAIGGRLDGAKGWHTDKTYRVKVIIEEVEYAD
jgi:hypothetical protein